MPVRKAISSEPRKVKIFHLLCGPSIKKPSTYRAMPVTNKINKTDKNSFKIVQSLLFEKYLKVFKILRARNMIIADKNPYKAIVVSKLNAPAACVLKGLYNEKNPKMNIDNIKVPLKGFFKI